MARIEDVIKAGETEFVEFKTSFNAEAVESLVAFANSKGGQVLIGVSNNGKVIGVELSDESVQHWINEIKGKTEPSIVPDVEVYCVDGKNIVSLGVREYPVKPVSMQGRFFKRVSNSNHQLSVGEIADEHLKTMNSSWDFYIDPNHQIDDISLEKMDAFVSKVEGQIGRRIAEIPSDFLNKLEIIRRGNVTFGAYLLFAKDYCLLSEMQLGRFKSDITIIDSVTLNSDLFSEVDETMAFIKKHLMVEYVITGNPQHEERFDYPLEAIREIVVNMIVHRDYRSPLTSIVKIYDDRMEFFNPGNLYGGLTIEKLLSNNYTSQARNKLVAKAFKEAGLVERYGSGIKRITDICIGSGLPAPLFESTESGFRVVVYKTRNMENVNGVSAYTHEYVRTENPTKNPTKNPTENPTENLTQLERKIVDVLENNPSCTQKQLAEEIAVGYNTVREYIVRLRNKGAITRIGSARSGYWKVNR